MGILDHFEEIPTYNKLKFTFIDLFTDIGDLHLATSTLDDRHIFASKFDDNACQTYQESRLTLILSNALSLVNAQGVYIIINKKPIDKKFYISAYEAKVLKV